jgi:hypothetical protein
MSCNILLYSLPVITDTDSSINDLEQTLYTAIHMHVHTHTHTHTHTPAAAAAIYSLGNNCHENTAEQLCPASQTYPNT